jgi:hypothetical protein
MKQFDDVEKKSFRGCRIKRMMRGKLGGANDRLPFLFAYRRVNLQKLPGVGFLFFLSFFFLQMNAVKKWRGNNDEWVRGGLRDKGGN